MKFCALLVGSAAAGSIEVITSDLYGNTRKSIDNVKAKWSHGISFLGRDATLTGKYDRSAKKDFLNEVSLAGKAGSLNYDVVHNFGSESCGLTVDTKTADGTKVEAKLDAGGLHLPSMSKVTMTRAASVRNTDCELKLAHDFKASESKLKLSTALGSGLKAIATVSSKGNENSLAYDFEYDTDLTEGRTVSAKVNPQSGSGSIEYEDSATIDGTINAKLPLGGKPQVTVKRAWSF